MFLFIHSAGEGRFGKAFIVHYGIIEAESAGKIIGGKAVSFKDSACDIASKAALADYVNGFSGFDFGKTPAKFIHRNIFNTSLITSFTSKSILLDLYTLI